MIIFEDNMLVNGKSNILCKIGLATYKHQLFEILVKVMDIEKIDYIKINFSEVFGDNSENWAWYTVKNEY